ncbi:hypothetical protein D9613_012735 [Agrocybe pediades]|uniref:Flavoprotein domain-containing protein n=1 Tax=Agrocybe pediades TaxID=84607 RepID=A0A8H4QK08_9AGAR|nr:hypothetical protein D9613_012735 [Agrocybe pediades]
MTTTSTSRPSPQPRSFTAADVRVPGHTHVLLITTGSVASIKAPLTVKELMSYKNTLIQVVASKASLAFYTKEDIAEASGGKVTVWTDEDEWGPTNFVIGSPILHIELRRWADIVLVAPCSANTMAKIAGGLCDNLVTSLLRALSPSTPTYLFPAMNTLMYTHPLTAKHLAVIREEIGYTVIGPQGAEGTKGKALACGDVGIGAMTEWKDIVGVVVEKFGLIKDACTPPSSIRASISD